MIIEGNDDNIVVFSFTKDDTRYTIEVNQENNEMISCTCLDQKSSGACCKHMYLVVSIFFDRELITNIS